MNKDDETVMHMPRIVTSGDGGGPMGGHAAVRTRPAWAEPDAQRPERGAEWDALTARVRRLEARVDGYGCTEVERAYLDAVVARERAQAATGPGTFAWAVKAENAARAALREEVTRAK